MFNYSFLIKNSFLLALGFSIVFPENSSSSINDKFSYLKNIYSDSWAVIIGINEYEHVEPLSYAVNDANSIRDLLVKDYGFPEKNIKLILDKEATKDNILQGFNDVLLKAGDVVVQRGTNHAWANRGTEPCTIMFVLIDGVTSSGEGKGTPLRNGN